MTRYLLALEKLHQQLSPPITELAHRPIVHLEQFTAGIAMGQQIVTAADYTKPVEPIAKLVNCKPGFGSSP